MNNMRFMISFYSESSFKPIAEGTQVSFQQKFQKTVIDGLAITDIFIRSLVKRRTS
jgi:hypothetical protein